MAEAASRHGPGGMTGTQVAAAISDQRVTWSAIVADAEQALEEWEPGLGAVVARIPLAQPPVNGSLSGFIVGLKDLISVHGLPRRGGAPKDWVFPIEETSATLVARLVAAGATPLALLATANVWQAGQPGGTTPSTANPRFPHLISGGSSGGSAAAVAAGIIHVGIGTDAGGSIRIPSACCGVVGLAPTRGLVPLTGVQHLTYSFDTAGPIARVVADARLALTAMAGPDPNDPYAAEPAAGAVQPNTLVVGVPQEVVDGPLSPDVRRAWNDALEGLKEKGADVRHVDVPLYREAPRLARLIGRSESVSRIAEDYGMGVDRGGEVADPELELPSLIDLVRGYDEVRRWRVEVRRLFEEVSVLVTPTLACRVPEAEGQDRETDVQVDGHRETRTSALTRLVNPWNLVGCPAGTIPVGRDDTGGPVSVQVIGPRFGDGLVLDVMQMIEARFSARHG